MTRQSKPSRVIRVLSARELKEIRQFFFDYGHKTLLPSEERRLLATLDDTNAKLAHVRSELRVLKANYRKIMQGAA